MNRNLDKSFVNKIKKIRPLNRMAKKNEYNDLVLFLCSDESSYITGTQLLLMVEDQLLLFFCWWK